MAFPRTQHQLTMLPDGTVLATGGSRNSNVYDTSTAVLPAELWNPATETWQTLSSGAVPRMITRWRSCCRMVELPSPAGVIPTGSEYPEFRYEYFSPPYLQGIAADDHLGALVASPLRPVLFRLHTGRHDDHEGDTHPARDDHPWLQHEPRSPDPGVLPGNGWAQRNRADEREPGTPGKYMLFIVKSNGATSVASWIGLGSPRGNPRCDRQA